MFPQKNKKIKIKKQSDWELQVVQNKSKIKTGFSTETSPLMRKQIQLLCNQVLASWARPSVENHLAKSVASYSSAKHELSIATILIAAFCFKLAKSECHPICTAMYICLPCVQHYSVVLCPNGLLWVCCHPVLHGFSCPQFHLGRPDLQEWRRALQ